MIFTNFWSAEFCDYNTFIQNPERPIYGYRLAINHEFRFVNPCIFSGPGNIILATSFIEMMSPLHLIVLEQ